MTERLGDVNIGELKRLLTSFSCAVNAGAQYVGVDGERVEPEHFGQMCSFCAVIQGCGEGMERCRRSLLGNAREAARFGEPYIARCHAGLIEIVTAVMMGDTLRGALSCGPILMWDWDTMTVAELADRTSDLPVSQQELLVASREIRVLEARTVRGVADMLHILAAQLAQSDALRHRKEISDQQALIWELVISQQGGAGAASYPMEMERELMELVRRGDRAGAKRILNQLLGRVFYATADVAVIKARVLELVVMVSRSAVEVGASLNVLLGMNYHFISELSHLVSFEDVCAWVVKVLDAFLDAALESRSAMKTTHALERVMSLVRSRFRENLTLESVAQTVHVSPFYLSHLLKEHYGFTFVEYLTRVRVEEAKTLLVGTGRSIRQIAADCGYADAGYFTKVFRKVTDMTPGEYRKRNHRVDK